eukprot:TRINITY_DN933_c0_g2_i14.p1 TRINITY_DN933_c0_g2~~TRINITY_DN933_c0_g2_i14.p1  ORF type:complete len:629 (+),score=158.48 TRINITY_DN933_c0_g2_i14:164-2050(+)
MLRNDSDNLKQNYHEVDAGLIELEEVGINQSHDAVSGTENQHTADDYAYLLHKGLEHARGSVHRLAIEETRRDIGEAVEYTECQTNNSAHACQVTYVYLVLNQTVLVKVFNPTNEREEVLRIKVPHGHLKVIDRRNYELAADVICANETDETDCDLFFKARLAGFTNSYFKIVPTEETESIKIKAEGIMSWLQFSKLYAINEDEAIKFHKNHNEFEIISCRGDFDESGNRDCFNQKLKLTYNYYQSYFNLLFPWENDGAYIFRPSASTHDSPKRYVSLSVAEIYRGQVLTQVKFNWGKIQTNLRVYDTLRKGIEIETFVDSIDIWDFSGKEIILRVQSDIDNGKVFFTDANGMEMQKRVLNYRPTFKLDVREPVAGNYYPVDTAIQIIDQADQTTLTLLNDRAQGGSSLNKGQVEVMLQRKIYHDDWRGVNEGLMESGPDGSIKTWIKNTLLVTRPGYIERDWREIQFDQDHANVILLAYSNSSMFDDVVGVTADEEDFALNFVPRLVKLLMRPMGDKTFLVRLHNMADSETQTVQLNQKWKSLKWEEKSLTANMDKAEVFKKRLNWNNEKFTAQLNEDYKDGHISLRAQEIRTFLVTRNQRERRMRVFICISDCSLVHIVSTIVNFE